MQQKILQLLTNSLTKLQISLPKDIQINHTKDKKFGDFATNIAMTLAKQEKTNPRDLATKIINNLPTDSLIVKAEIAGAGFINFFINQNSTNTIITDILELANKFGQSDFGKSQKVLLEFVSANPTGPLHVGHGRGAAFGATLSNLLTTVGFKVDNEYYVNDAGRQMDILTTSVYLRYIKTDKFPTSGYQGDYIVDIANKLSNIPIIDIFSTTCRDGCDGGDKEQYIDELINNCKSLLREDYAIIFKLTITEILQNIKQDLVGFRVKYQQFFSEKSLSNNNLNQKTIQKLQNSGDIYENANALWFRTTKYGDEKDRVVVRDNGIYTYFATDIAYHLEKFERSYDQIINIWGADHHGYITRVKASIKALGFNANKLTILLVQFANLFKDGQKLAMSTRSGSFVTLKALYSEVGVDATRFFYIMRKVDQHLDFDMNLAKSKTNENPVFYIQYAHARICSVLAKINNVDNMIANPNLSLLTHELELDLIKKLNKYQDVLINAAKQYEPHQLAYYLRDLAGKFHSYYNNCDFLQAEAEIKKSRLALISSIKIIICNGLDILGVSSPEKM